MHHSTRAWTAARRAGARGNDGPMAEPKAAASAPAGSSGPRLGWGACSVSGCPCRAYEKAYGTDLCDNCGHDYQKHW